jgi:hypothetical protein
LRDLAEDLQGSAISADVKEFEFLSTLEPSVRDDLTVQNFRASEKHFMSVHTLSALAQNRVPGNSRNKWRSDHLATDFRFLRVSECAAFARKMKDGIAT